MKTKVGIVTPVLVYGDAVGTDVLGMYSTLLNSNKYTPYLFCDKSLIKEHTYPISKVPSILFSPNDIIIYHHSIACDSIFKFLPFLRCRKIVKYHNITPPDLISKYNSFISTQCRLGIQQLGYLLRIKVELWVDSLYNVPGNSTHEILPPFNNIDTLFSSNASKDDLDFSSSLNDSKYNLLYLGRISPSKNVSALIVAFSDLYKFIPNTRLLIVGFMDDALRKYTDEINSLIISLNLSKSILLLGKLSDSRLKSILLISDVLITASLHEGFCVPLVEAMAFRIPIVAFNKTAIPFTAGSSAVYFDSDDPKSIIHSLEEVLESSSKRLELITNGISRYNSLFSNAVISKRFLELLN